MVSRRLPAQIDAARFEHVQLEQLLLDIRRSRPVANALERFADDEVREAKPLAIELRIEPGGLGIADAAEVRAQTVVSTMTTCGYFEAVQITSTRASWPGASLMRRSHVTSGTSSASASATYVAS
jgi:hypothetical protein